MTEVQIRRNDRTHWPPLGWVQEGEWQIDPGYRGNGWTYYHRYEDPAQAYNACLYYRYTYRNYSWRVVPL